MLLDEVYENKDFITAKYCLILSQTYNKLESITNKKIFLQDTIEKNKLLRNTYFWEEYICCKLNIVCLLIFLLIFFSHMIE